MHLSDVLASGATSFEICLAGNGNWIATVRGDDVQPTKGLGDNPMQAMWRAVELWRQGIAYRKPKERYWFHPETDSVYATTADQLPSEDGLSEEIDFEKFEQMKEEREARTRTPSRPKILMDDLDDLLG